MPRVLGTAGGCNEWGVLCGKGCGFKLLFILYPCAELAISYNYNPLLIRIFLFKTAEELTVTSEVWYGQSVVQKWLQKVEEK